MQVNLIHITPEAEKHIAYCARVSSPNQDNPEFEKLLTYCIKHEHWSIFEMASMCLEIETSRAISAQILRHRSFSFQEFSQRYSDDIVFETFGLRPQSLKNKQCSEDIDADRSRLLKYQGAQVINCVRQFYLELLDSGVAKECARMLLPMCTKTKMYMHGTIRSWIHYIQLRTKEDTQKEHREVAEECKKIFIQQFPVISKALGW